jgi:hypothetical protein
MKSLEPLTCENSQDVCENSQGPPDFHMCP